MKYTKKQQLKISRKRQLSVKIFSFTMVIGMVIGCVFFVRPSESIVEKRTLSKFPKFTISSFLDGSYFSDISTWYSDTYPARDKLIAMNQSLQSTYGIESDTQMIGGNKKGDEIGSTTSSSKKKKKKNAKVPDTTELQADMQDQIMDNLYVEDGAAYSIYYFNQDAATTYIDALNSAAKSLKGTTDVYSILVPNNSGALLDEDTLDKLGGSDQVEAIDYYHDSYSDNVVGVNTIKTLRQHRDEYLYFRTDHHWTSLGAYYVYQNFCKDKGIKAHKLSYFKEKKTFSPFLGTFYDELQSSDMEANPDYVDAYVPNGTNKLTYWDENGDEHEWNVIRDVSDWGESTGYYCFIGGDNPLTKIHNPKIDDGSSVVVVKESYGNCFVPYLVDHYENVYVIDYRYTDKNIVDFCKEKKIDDLIIINNIQLIAADSVATKIQNELSTSK